jgi:hypothetical protein
VTSKANDYEDYIRVLNQVVQNPQLAHAFASATVRHRQVEQAFNRNLVELCPAPRALQYPHFDLSPSQYWQRNFFSTLFLSIFEAVGITAERQHSYGMILHGVRGIVTATDNILDDESKGSVRLELGGAKILPNVLLILLETGLLHQLLNDLSDDPKIVAQTWQALMRALFALGTEESGEEGRVDEVLSPERLLDEVHRFRGGGLLCLAFVAPELNEPALNSSIRAAKVAVNQIGLALQVIDDITDFDEDLAALNHNMLRSWIVHRQPDGHCTDADLRALSTEIRRVPEQRFPVATREVMSLAIEMAVDGFDRLRQLGHAVDRASGLELIAAMFRLRGLERIWNVFADERRAHSGESALNYRALFPVAPN